MLLIGVASVFGNIAMSPTGTVEWFVFLEYSIWGCRDNVFPDYSTDRVAASTSKADD